MRGSEVPAPNGQRNHGRGSTPVARTMARSAARDVGRPVRSCSAAASAHGSASDCPIRWPAVGDRRGRAPGTPPPSGPARRTSRARRPAPSSVEHAFGPGRPVRSVGMLGVEGQRDPPAHRAAYFSIPVMTMPRVKKRWKARKASDRDDEGHERAGLDEPRIAVVDAVEPLQAQGDGLDLHVARRVEQRPEEVVPRVDEVEDRDRDDDRPALGQHHGPERPERARRHRSRRLRRDRSGSS